MSFLKNTRWILFLSMVWLVSACMPLARPGGVSSASRTGARGTPSALPDSKTVRWDELLAIVDHKIAISLEGAYLKGEARALTQDSLEMQVSETSNPGIYPLGRTRIPRSEVSAVMVWTSTRRESALGEQMAGQAASGGIIGLGVLGSGRAGSILGRMAAGLGGAVLGAIVGRELDDEEVYTVIHIAPEP